MVLSSAALLRLTSSAAEEAGRSIISRATICRRWFYGMTSSGLTFKTHLHDVSDDAEAVEVTAAALEQISLGEDDYAS